MPTTATLISPSTRGTTRHAPGTNSACSSSSDEPPDKPATVIRPRGPRRLLNSPFADSPSPEIITGAGSRFAEEARPRRCCKDEMICFSNRAKSSGPDKSRDRRILFFCKSLEPVPTSSISFIGVTTYRGSLLKDQPKASAPAIRPSM